MRMDPGLPRRFPESLDFKDYLPKDLAAICKKMAYQRFEKTFNDVPTLNVANLGEDTEDLEDPEAAVGRVDKLDTTFMDDEDKEEDKAVLGGAGEESGTGSLGIIRDNLMSSLTIDDYMKCVCDKAESSHPSCLRSGVALS